MAGSVSKMKADAYVEQAIVQLLALKIRAGTPLPQLRRRSLNWLKQATAFTGSTPDYQGLDIHRLGSILRLWHKERHYLTYDGLPRPLRRLGKVSLSSLVKKVYPAEKFDRVFDFLVETDLIKRESDTTWVPSGRTARIPRASHETLEHLAEGVARYVETVTQNVTAKDESEVLFERSCKVARLPVAEFGAFRDFVGEQALAFLTGIDDWLESRNQSAKKSRRKTCVAGVYTFAYVSGEFDPRRSSKVKI